MEKETFTNQDITAYLLGSLPGERTEYFDELSFTDDDFADRLRAGEKDLVDAFVQGELKGSELDRFNAFYLASPRRRQKVEFARSLQGLAAREVPTAEVSRKKSLGEYLAALLTIPRLSLQWGFAAATLVLVLFGGWMFFENSRLRSEFSRTGPSRDELLKREAELAEREKRLTGQIANQPADNANTQQELARINEEREQITREMNEVEERERRLRQRESELARAERRQPTDRRNRDGGADSGRTPGPVIAAFVLSPSLRGSQLATLSIPPKTTTISLSLELESADYSFYQAVLRDQAGDRAVWQSGKLRIKRNGTNPLLNIRFPARLLTSQIYSVQISGGKTDGSTEIISDYPFRAVLR